MKIIFTEIGRSKEINRSRIDKESLWVVKKRKFPWVKNSETTLLCVLESNQQGHCRQRMKCLTAREEFTNKERRRLENILWCWIGVGGINMDSQFSFNICTKNRQRHKYRCVCMCYVDTYFLSYVH